MKRRPRSALVDPMMIPAAAQQCPPAITDADRAQAARDHPHLAPPPPAIDDTMGRILAVLQGRPDAREILTQALAAAGSDAGTPPEPVDDDEPFYAAGVAPVPCKYCGRPVVWITTPKGKKLCCDTRAAVFIIAQAGVRAGDLVGANANTPSMRERQQPLFTKPIVGVYVTHFATCRRVEQVKRDQAKKKGES